MNILSFIDNVPYSSPILLINIAFPDEEMEKDNERYSFSFLAMLVKTVKASIARPSVLLLRIATDWVTGGCELSQYN